MKMEVQEPTAVAQEAALPLVVQVLQNSMGVMGILLDTVAVAVVWDRPVVQVAPMAVVLVGWVFNQVLVEQPPIMEEEVQGDMEPMPRDLEAEVWGHQVQAIQLQLGQPIQEVVVEEAIIHIARGLLGVLGLSLFPI